MNGTSDTSEGQHGTSEVTSEEWYIRSHIRRMVHQKYMNGTSEDLRRSCLSTKDKNSYSATLKSTAFVIVAWTQFLKAADLGEKLTPCLTCSYKMSRTGNSAFSGKFRVA
ncbi:hypothetical protein CDAR_306751 [Caerostris darwini]|uniref:Uncharacterized protein n=1 Tax=Caerostris darwini TaxID=1538125 RepID=A0AAV4SDV9_9ARAC|nr:hypothetical protein CDAR_306751 [Caerostris darwini]